VVTGQTLNLSRLRLGTTEVTVARGDPILQEAGKFGRLQKQAGIPLDIKKALKEVKSL